MNYLPWIAGGAVVGAVYAGRSGRRAAGLCFPFATKMAQDSTNAEFFDKSKLRVVHGEVLDRLTGRYIAHAWVEKGSQKAGRAFDWQTREVKPEGFTLKQFYATFKPRNMVMYTAEQATLNCFSGNWGPWDPQERASGRGRRAAGGGVSYFSASWIANAEEEARAYKTKELFAYMPPEEFLALAAPFSREGESPSKRENVLRLLTENTRFRDGPALSFDETGQVYGHEGRHRATALLRMGVARIPVLLRARGGTGIRWGEQDDPTAWGYNKNLPSWLLSEEPGNRPPHERAAWRQKRVAAPWYTRGPERGQLRPEYRVPSTGRTARRGRRAAGGVVTWPTFRKQPPKIAKKTAKHRGRRTTYTHAWTWRDLFGDDFSTLDGEFREDGARVGWMRVIPVSSIAIPCLPFYRKLQDAHGEAPIYEVNNVDIEWRLRNKGHGTRFYQAAIEKLRETHPEGFYLVTSSCGRGFTKAQAARVFVSLARRFPAAGSGYYRALYIPPQAGRRAEAYPWLSLAKIKKYEQLMRDRGVSEVARSPRGFLTAFKRAGSKTRLSPEWRMKRDGFIARHWTQAQKQARPLYETKGKYAGTPTRWHLALIAWGFSPDGAKAL